MGKEILEVFKALRVPTPKDMEGFAKNFTKDQWARLCNVREFTNLLLSDLTEAKKVAQKILGAP